MYLSPISYNNKLNLNNYNKTNNLNVEKNNQIKNCLKFSQSQEILGKSIVNFRGTLNLQDRMLVGTLVRELHLPENLAQKVKQTVIDFIKEGKYASLSDIAGEEFINEQSMLLTKISEIVDLSDIQSQYVINEITNRCDDKENYSPTSFNVFKKEFTALENLLFQAGKMTKQSIEKFYQTLTTNLRLTKDSVAEFKDMIENYVNENGLMSLQDIGKEENLMLQAELVEKISKKFNFSEVQESVMMIELDNFAESKLGQYEPITSPYAIDKTAFSLVCNKYQVKSKESWQLFNIMKNEAEQKQCSNIFEIFSKGEIINSPTIDFLKKFKPNCYVDMVLDFGLMGKDAGKISLNSIKHQAKDNFYAIAKEMVFLTNFQKEFDVSDSILINIHEKIKKRFPTHIEGGENIDIKQLAFEIADKYNLPIGAEKKIIKLVQDADNADIKTLDEYLVKRLFGISNEN